MRIIIAGGIYSKDSKFNNAVFCLAKSLSKKSNVKILSISRFPFLSKVPKDSLKIIKPGKKIIFKLIKNFYSSYKIISDYVNFFSIYGVIVFFRFLINRSNAEIMIIENKYDIINIHSTDLERYAFFYVLLKNNLPFVTTVHGLYSLDKNFNNSYDAEKLEIKLLSEINKRRYPIIFVSSGFKKAALDKFKLDDSNLHVIPNGVDIKKFNYKNLTEKEEIRKKYGIPLDSKVIIQVGNLYKIKNHITVLEAISKMDKKMKNDVLMKK